MHIQFKEEFAVPVDILYRYFKTPADWCRLYGIFGPVKELDDGWHVVTVKNCPLPLVAKVSILLPYQLVHWEYRGGWRGEGEVRFTEADGKTVVEGYEDISIGWLFFLSPLAEKLFFERGFKKIWTSGWQQIRKLENIP